MPDLAGVEIEAIQPRFEPIGNRDAVEAGFDTLGSGLFEFIIQLSHLIQGRGGQLGDVPHLVHDGSVLLLQLYELLVQFHDFLQEEFQARILKGLEIAILVAEILKEVR